MSLTGRVSIGFDANMLDANPTWTCIDSLRDNLVARIEIRDGRQTESDETEAGTCTVWLNDTTGLFDPNNPSSPYFSKLDGKPIAIAAWNPIDAEWVPQWRGTVDDWRTVLNPATDDGVSVLANVQIEAVGMFDYLARAEMRIGVSGNPPPADSPGIIWYEDGPIANPGGPPGRIEQLLDDAGIDNDMYVAFSGNVDVLESAYDVGDDFLSALREAADAELPGLANIYEDKLGRFVFHGRFARLDPDSVWTSIAGTDAGRDAVWRFRRWKAGDGAAIDVDSDCAQVREFAFARPRSMLINSATCYPADIADADIPGQISEDAASIALYGIHGRADAGLIVKGHKTNGDTGAEQCLKYAQFWTTYYAYPLDRVERIVFKSLKPSDARADVTWALLTGISISDVLTVYMGYPGGVGIQGIDHYVEGRLMSIEPLNDDHDLITLELNLSPYIEDTDGIFG